MANETLKIIESPLLLRVATNDQMIHYNVVPPYTPYTSILPVYFEDLKQLITGGKFPDFCRIRKPQSLDITKKNSIENLIKNDELPFLNILLTQLLKLAFTILLIRLIYNELNWSLYRVNLPVLITHWYELVPTSLNRLSNFLSEILL